MLKVKKTIYAPPNETNQINQLRLKWKETVKKLHIESKKKIKTINEYAALISSIRKEYEILYNENQNLKTENQKLKDYNNRQLDYDRKVIRKLPKIPPQRKRKYWQVYQSCSSDSEDANNYYYKYSKKKKRKQKRNKVFYDDVDGEHDYIEEILPSDEDDIDESNVETEIEEKPIQKISKISKISKIPSKKGITKSIKI